MVPAETRSCDREQRIDRLPSEFGAQSGIAQVSSRSMTLPPIGPLTGPPGATGLRMWSLCVAMIRPSTTPVGVTTAMDSMQSSSEGSCQALISMRTGVSRCTTAGSLDALAPIVAADADPTINPVTSPNASRGAAKAGMKLSPQWPLPPCVLLLLPSCTSSSIGPT